MKGLVLFLILLTPRLYGQATIPAEDPSKLMFRADCPLVEVAPYVRAY